MTDFHRRSAGTVDLAPLSTPTSGIKNVTTAGTRVPLVVTATPAHSVVLKPRATNTGNIYVGGSGVTAANGYPLAPTDGPLSMDIGDLSAIYLDADVNGDGVHFLAVE